MKKTVFIIALVLCSCLSVFSQATSLTVDCQNPGWLSSKINYGDQVTLQNIKVTGYINATDLQFIGTLNTNQQLNGVIDLEDVQIVGTTNDDNNTITQGYFGGHIQHLKLPKSLVSATACLNGATLDSLTVGGEALPIITNNLFYPNIYSGGDGVRFNEKVKHLILREGVTTIADRAFYNEIYNSYGAMEDDCVFESINIPSTVTCIGKNAFRNNYALKKARLSDNIEEIGDFAFKSTKLYSDNDTIYLPQKLKYFYFSSFATGSDAFGSSTHIYYGFANQHIFIPKSVTGIDASSIYLWGGYEKCYLHIANENPPILSGMTSGMYSYLVVYVPKNSVDIYKSNTSWKNATILAEPNPAKSINIEQESLEMVKGTTRQLKVTVLPEDADDMSYTLSSSNEDVASVSRDGLVTAVSSGEARIIVALNADNTITDYCIVKVFQPVAEVNLNINSATVKVGETLDLTATILPKDADNKRVIWSSSDEKLATVDNGEVTALKAGSVWIKAVSEDNAEAKDSCKVIVQQPVNGITLNHNTYTMNHIGDSFELEATVQPDDASNKNIKWKSSNESVCVVSNGTVIAVGDGTCVIIATTEDGGYMATCTVTVTVATGVSFVEIKDGQPFQIYDVNGMKRTSFKRGINIIRFVDGTMKKVQIK